MVEIKMTFGSADDAIAFLTERASAKTVTNSTPAVATAEVAPATTKAAADPKPAKAQKVEASPSAAPAETVSAAAGPAPAPTPTPSPAPAPVAPAGKPMEYASSDLPKRIAEMVGHGHTAAMKALLAEFGAKKGPEIPVERLHEFDEKLKNLEQQLTQSVG